MQSFLGISVDESSALHSNFFEFAVFEKQQTNRPMDEASKIYFSHLKPEKMISIKFYISEVLETITRKKFRGHKQEEGETGSSKEQFCSILKWRFDVSLWDPHCKRDYFLQNVFSGLKPGVPIHPFSPNPPRLTVVEISISFLARFGAYAKGAANFQEAQVNPF